LLLCVGIGNERKKMVGRVLRKEWRRDMLSWCLVTGVYQWLNYTRVKWG
jgi:hypothetical protein